VSPVSRPAISASNSQAEYQQLSQRVERLERVRNNTSQEIISEGEEELNLLKEIREQLNSIQSEIRSLKKTKNPHAADKQPLDLLQEVCLLLSLSPTHACRHSQVRDT
jgi:seryl-tRNA synthetase